MIIGVLKLEFLIHGSSSLKEKRMVMRSVKEKVSKKFNVSVAEIDYLNKWQRALVACAFVTNSKAHAEEVLQKIFHILDQGISYEIINHTFEYR